MTQIVPVSVPVPVPDFSRFGHAHGHDKKRDIRNWQGVLNGKIGNLL